DLADAVLREDQHVDRERVEHLVREHHAADRRERAGHGRPAQLAALEREGLLLAQPRRDLDDRRARRARRLGPLLPPLDEPVAQRHARSFARIASMSACGTPAVRRYAAAPPNARRSVASTSPIVQARRATPASTSAARSGLSSLKRT